MGKHTPHDEQFPNVLDAPDFDNAWKMYTHFREIENQFNVLQSTYRTLASTWLLATFAGVGFVLTKLAEIDWIIDNALIITFIGLVGGIGIFLLWMIDIMVYQQLLYAAFVSGVSLEERYPWLPPIRQTMKKTQFAGNVRYRVVWYYITGVSIPLLISLISFTSWFYEFERKRVPETPAVSAIFVAVAGIAAIVLIGRYLHTTSTKNIEDDEP